MKTDHEITITDREFAEQLPVDERAILEGRADWPGDPMLTRLRRRATDEQLRGIYRKAYDGWPDEAAAIVREAIGCDQVEAWKYVDAVNHNIDDRNWSP